MPDGIPRNTRHFDSRVLPIPHQSGLRLTQPIGNVTWFLCRNVLKWRYAVVLHVPGGGFGMTSCVTPAKPAGIVVPSFSKSWQVSATGSEVFQHGESAQEDGPVV